MNQFVMNTVYAFVDGIVWIVWVRHVVIRKPQNEGNNPNSSEIKNVNFIEIRMYFSACLKRFFVVL